MCIHEKSYGRRGSGIHATSPRPSIIHTSHPPPQARCGINTGGGSYRERNINFRMCISRVFRRPVSTSREMEDGGDGEDLGCETQVGYHLRFRRCCNMVCPRACQVSSNGDVWQNFGNLSLVFFEAINCKAWSKTEMTISSNPQDHIVCPILESVRNTVDQYAAVSRRQPSPYMKMLEFSSTKIRHIMPRG